MALTVLFQAIDQSPPFLTVLVGSTAPNNISSSPNFSTLRSSFVVESCSLSTASRLTALPETTFFHSELGNSGQSDWLVSERLVALGSIVYALINLWVLARLSDNTVHLSFLLVTHANADSSTLAFLEAGSPSERCSSSSERAGLVERPLVLNFAPFLLPA